ncbi:hypothetical protein KIN20_022338 [Parelaphostrongylus tenuis]|uniref:Uncharacterized protein n=1 Tax=Parelaphostrongylus tenuis TaxID=148309 RepID=A0AAD5MQG7_PARTN|nr:hypothetical protein KIN20_022338 [Parelaphostrongylus tenuis]
MTSSARGYINVDPKVCHSTAEFREDRARGARGVAMVNGNASYLVDSTRTPTALHRPSRCPIGN